MYLPDSTVTYYRKLRWAATTQQRPESNALLPWIKLNTALRGSVV